MREKIYGSVENSQRTEAFVRGAGVPAKANEDADDEEEAAADIVVFGLLVYRLFSSQLTTSLPVTVIYPFVIFLHKRQNVIHSLTKT